MLEIESSSLTFKTLMKMSFVFFKYIIVVVMSLTLVIVAMNGFKFDMTTIELLILFFAGFLGSVAIHEYAHVWCMKRFGIQKVEITNSFLKLSVITREKIQGIKLVIIASSGPFLCGMIGMILHIIFKNEVIFGFQLLSYIYLLHLINLFPFFGDGRMVIKGLLSLKQNKD